MLLTRRGNLEKKMFWKRLQEAFFFLIVCLFLKGGGDAVNYGCEINLEDWLLCRAGVSWEALYAIS